mmetsp:Transcript_70149/g.62927  ORF Transcript_70149/g.62927 Transcript_70149/m.62927 type:complete len:1037 (-) Transcript_70149:449-3559(-)
MGAELGKCVCAPDPNTDEISMEKRGERDRIEDDSVDTDSSTEDGSSSEGDGTTDESGSETGEDDSSFIEGGTDSQEDDDDDEEESQSSYSSERDKKNKYTKYNHHNYHHKSNRKGRDRGTMRMQDSSESESYESSEDDENDRNMSDNHSRHSKRSDTKNKEYHQHHNNHHGHISPEQPPMERKGSLKDINPHKKKMQKEKDRLQRKLNVISNKNTERQREKLMEQQRNATSHSLFNNGYEEPTAIPVKRAQSNQYHMNGGPHSYYDDHQDPYHDNHSNDSRSVRSLPQQMDNNSNPNKHKKIGSMADFDPAALQLLARNSQSLFDPNYTITTVDPQQSTNLNLTHTHSIYGASHHQHPPQGGIHGIKVAVPQQHGTSSQPISPRTDFSGFNFNNKAMTPNTYQYDNSAQRTGHGYSASMDWQHARFPNIHNQQTGINMNDNLGIRRTNSNPSFINNHNPSFDMMVPQNAPQIPYSTNNSSMNTVKIISDDSSSQHHIVGGGIQYVEDDIDLPAMPPHNRSNSLPTMTPTNAESGGTNSENVFDISSRAGVPFGALFHDIQDKQINHTDLPDIIDNTPVSTIKPNSQLPSKESNLTSSNKSSSHNSNHTQNTTEIKPDMDEFGDQPQAQNENDMIMNPNDTDNKENDSDDQNKNDVIPPTDISPKEIKKSSPVPSGIKTNLNTMAGFTAISKKSNDKKSLSDIKIHDKDPNAIPASPPIDSVYKPMPQSGMMSRLSQISESNGLSSITSTPVGYTPNDKDTIPETNVVNKSSNESFPDGAYPNDERMNVPPEINTESPLPDPSTRPNHLNPQQMHLMNEAVSSPSDDDDTVAQQWMDLHQMNIHDNNLPDPGMQNPMLSMHTDISSDQDDADQEVAQWKQQQISTLNMENVDSGLSTGALAPQSSDEDADQDDHKGLPQKPTKFVSQYSSETNPSTDYVEDTEAETDAISDFPVDDNMPKINNKQNKRSGHADKRHSSLLRRSSLHKWKTDEVNDEVHDMQRQLQHMQDEEQDALIAEMSKLKEKAKKSNQQQWIDQ